MIAPVGAESFAEAMRVGTEVYHELRNIIVERYGALSASVGDEGGFAPDVASIEVLSLSLSLSRSLSLSLSRALSLSLSQLAAAACISIYRSGCCYRAALV